MANFSSRSTRTTRTLVGALLAALLVASLTTLLYANYLEPRTDAPYAPHTIPTRPVAVMTVYSYRTEGICAPCDKARPIVQRLATKYPIARVYPDVVGGRARCQEDRVDAFPTFVLRVAYPDGGIVETARWAGVYGLEARIVDAFRQIGYLPTEYLPTDDKK